MREPRIVLRTLLAVLAAISMPLRHAAQQPSALAGDVRDVRGAPLAGVAVSIVTSAGVAETVNTDAAGAFRFPGAPAKPYVLRALDATHSQRTELGIDDRTATAGSLVHLVLTAAPPAMQFADAPDFTIAGVTDWTAVGGHGSDATLRTSEDLAREAVVTPDLPKAATARDAAKQVRLEAEQQAAPHSYQANRQLGDFYLRTRDYRRAETFLRAASVLHGASADDEYSLALVCDRLGDPKQANEHLQRASAMQNTEQFQRLAGEVSEHLGQPLQALEHFQRAVAIQPSEQNYFSWASELLLHRAIWQAAEVFAKGSALYPRSTRLLTGWGAALFAGARYSEAAQRFCAASTLEPADREAYLLLGKAALAAPEPLPCAQQRLADFLHRQPQDADALYYSAMLLLREGKSENKAQAEKMFREAVTLDPKLAGASVQLGILEADQGHAADAIRFYRQAVQADPMLAEAHYRLGLVLDRNGQHDEAQRELALHAQLVQQQAAAVEQQRRSVKQFLVAQKPADRNEPAEVEPQGPRSDLH